MKKVLKESKGSIGFATFQTWIYILEKQLKAFERAYNYHKSLLSQEKSGHVDPLSETVSQIETEYDKLFANIKKTMFTLKILYQFGIQARKHKRAIKKGVSYISTFQRIGNVLRLGQKSLPDDKEDFGDYGGLSGYLKSLQETSENQPSAPEIPEYDKDVYIKFLEVPQAFDTMEAEEKKLNIRRAALSLLQIQSPIPETHFGNLKLAIPSALQAHINLKLFRAIEQNDARMLNSLMETAFEKIKNVTTALKQDGGEFEKKEKYYKQEAARLKANPNINTDGLTEEEIAALLEAPDSFFEDEPTATQEAKKRESKTDAEIMNNMSLKKRELLKKIKTNSAKMELARKIRASYQATQDPKKAKELAQQKAQQDKEKSDAEKEAGEQDPESDRPENPIKTHEQLVNTYQNKGAFTKEDIIKIGDYLQNGEDYYLSVNKVKCCVTN